MAVHGIVDDSDFDHFDECFKYPKSLYGLLSEAAEKGNYKTSRESRLYSYKPATDAFNRILSIQPANKS